MGPKGVPFIVTNDGRTIRFPHPDIKQNDTIKLSLRNNEVLNQYKFEEGCRVMITGGNNIGRVGTVVRREQHPGSYEIIYVKDDKGLTFSTRLQNVFVIGTKNSSEVTLLKAHNYLTIIQQREVRGNRFKARAADEEEGEEEEVDA